jgi:hypothetical protein
MGPLTATVLSQIAAAQRQQAQQQFQTSIQQRQDAISRVDDLISTGRFHSLTPEEQKSYKAILGVGRPKMAKKA